MDTIAQSLIFVNGKRVYPVYNRKMFITMRGVLGTVVVNAFVTPKMFSLFLLLKNYLIKYHLFIKNNIQYNSNIITNIYLLNLSILPKLYDLNIYNVQVTTDENEEIYHHIDYT